MVRKSISIPKSLSNSYVIRFLDLIQMHFDAYLYLGFLSDTVLRRKFVPYFYGIMTTLWYWFHMEK